MNHSLLSLIVLIALVVLRRVLFRVVMLLLARTVLRKFLVGIGNQAVNKQPDQIRLTPVPEHAWTDGGAVQALAAPLPPLGFAESGTYRVDELAGVFVRFLVQTEERVAAAIYEHPKVGTWIDLYCHYQDGGSFTATTARDTGLEKRPGATGFHAPGTAADALYERLLHERPRGGIEAMTPANVVERFAWAYSKATVWRKQRGVSVDEMAEQLRRHEDKRAVTHEST